MVTKAPKPRNLFEFHVLQQFLNYPTSFVVLLLALDTLADKTIAG